MSVTGLYVGNGTLRYQSVVNERQVDRAFETAIREAEREMLRENAAVRRDLIAEVRPIQPDTNVIAPPDNFGTIELSPVLSFQAAMQRLINETNYPMIFNMTRSDFMRFKKVLDSGNYEYANRDVHGEGSSILLIEVTVIMRKEPESNYRTEKQLTDLITNEILSTIFHFIGMLHPNADDSKIEAFVEKTMKPLAQTYANNILSILMEKEIEIDGRKRKIVRADNSTSPKPRPKHGASNIEELIDEVGELSEPDRAF